MATQIPEQTYTPGTYGPFSLTSGPLKRRSTFILTRTSGGVVVWPDGPCIVVVVEYRVQGNTWRQIERWTANGGGLALDRVGNPAVTSVSFPKPEGADIRVTVTVLQTLTTAISVVD